MADKFLDHILSELIHRDFTFNFATNSIRFSFDGQTSGHPSFMIWIEPFWRFVKDGHLILSSMTCPWHEDFEQEADYIIAFHSWCNTVKHLKTTPIKSINRKAGINDLTISWVDNTILEVYQDNLEQEAWYVLNKDNNEYLYAFPHKIATNKE